MKTSFPDLIKTEKYLHDELDAQETLLFEARLLVSKEWRANTYFHRMVHRLVQIYHRRKIKSEVETVHDRLFENPANASFGRQIMSLFKR
jgi:hypothetical protein